jgi:hypothetical protein
MIEPSLSDADELRAAAEAEADERDRQIADLRAILSPEAQR